MDNTDSNKSQQTGGLKLMTVFIAVLALHVLVIGGITVYHLMSGSSSDGDMAADKSHKTIKANSDGDGTLPDANVDKPAVAATTTNSAPTTPAVPEETAQNIPAPTPAPATSDAPSGPVQAPASINPPMDNPTLVSSGPVKMPVIQMAPQEQVLTPGVGTPYVVKSRDSLAKIAHQHHTTVAKLKAANGLNSDMLHIGQKLMIPERGELASANTPATPGGLDESVSTPSPVVKAPKTKIKAKTASMLAANPNEAAAPVAAPAYSLAPAPVAKASGHKTYTVAKGDTLTKIARRFKTTTSAIMAANSITDARKLSIGQKLRIPSAAERSATNTTTPEAPSAQQPAQPASGTGTSAQLANFVR